MQAKDEILGHLQPELLNETAKKLSNKDVVSVASTSTHHYGLFKPIIDCRKKLSPFLYHITHGNYEAVETMLFEEDMSLFYTKSRITDCSGRTFENISGFEYALWALDKHMWTTILECIPQTKEGAWVLQLLKGQYDNLNKKGVTYHLNGQTITEKHFDFDNTIIKALQTQVDSINAPDKNWDAIDKQWREGVGGAQKLLPPAVVDWYCSDVPFMPLPDFTSQPKSLKQFYNWTTNKDEGWFSVDSGLGTEFAIYKGTDVQLYVGAGWSSAAQRGDLDALTALCKVRTNDFIALKSQLEDKMTVDNHHQVSQI